MKKALLLLIATFFMFTAQAQITQTVRGTVVDAASKFPILGANATIKTTDGQFFGGVTDIDGKFRLEKTPVGRQTISFSYIGYQDVVMRNVIISAGKEMILTVEMEESATTLADVVVVAQQNGEVRNEMAFVATRSFKVAETNRYAGSRGDPGRMASNFAGVQGADDSRNDIIVRGNSPTGVLWRLEGVNIPNPNHFAIPGTGGGPVTVLNNKFLANSDFFTGAFPAEFGNGIAGVFDLKMRNGNNQQHEFSGQFGFLGTELTAEGPISKEKGSSYLAMYRYSTLQLFSFLGIQVGTDAVPRYQDAAFRFNFPGKNGSNLAFWAIGGLSNVDIVLSDAEAPAEETLIYGTNDRDQYFGSKVGVAGITYTYPVNKNTFVKATLSASGQQVDSNHDYIFRQVVDNQFMVDSLPKILGYQFTESKYAINAFVNRKMSSKTTIKFGLNADLHHYAHKDSVRLVTNIPGQAAALSDWRLRWDSDKNALLLQPFVQLKHKFSDKFSFIAGLTSVLFTLNKNSFSPVEPRLGLRYDLGKGKKLSFGYGLHSQTQAGYIYFYGKESKGNDPQEHNLGLGLTKSHHLVLSYDMPIGKNMRLKAETYYQYLYDIPVEMKNSSFSLVNTGSGFSRFFPDTLQNTGTGRNYGVELTLEKFFSNSYYFMLTGSVFDAKYKGSDGVLRNTSFNGHFAMNALFAKEFTFNKRNALNIGAKITYAGGRWYGPVDEAASAQELEIIYEDESVNTLQFKPYFRADIKINYLWNRSKVTHEFAIDLVNIFAIKNILTLTYAPDHPSGNPIREEYQLGFLPIFYYKLDF